MTTESPHPDNFNWQSIRPLQVVLSALFWTYLVVSLIAFWLFVVPIWLVISPFDPQRRFSHWYAIVWANHYLALSPFWDITVRGRDNIEDHRAYVIIANHQSMADIFVMYAIKKHFKWVAKSTLFHIPFLGWMMKMADYVPVTRGDARSRDDMLNRCLDQLRRGSSMAMFPEGTRSLDGNLRSFKLGAFVLAVDSQADVVPVVIDGTYDALPRNSWIFRHGRTIHVRVHVLPAISPREADDDAITLRKLVRNAMETELTRMRDPMTS